MILYTGLAIFSGAPLHGSNLVFDRLFLSVIPDGWTSVVASIWLLDEINIMVSGLIGIYPAKVFSETKQRPSFIVREIYGQNSKD